MRRGWRRIHEHAALEHATGLGNAFWKHTAVWIHVTVYSARATGHLWGAAGVLGLGRAVLLGPRLRHLPINKAPRNKYGWAFMGARLNLRRLSLLGFVAARSMISLSRTLVLLAVLISAACLIVQLHGFELPI